MNNNKFIYTINADKVLKDNNILLNGDSRSVLQKVNRPYYVSVPLTIKHSAFIPLRTRLPHRFGFVTKRSEDSVSGLDYTKSLIVERSSLDSYLVKESGISFKEAQVIKNNEYTIQNLYQKFVFETFIPTLEKAEKARTPKEVRLVTFSSLQYFETVLLQMKTEPRAYVQ